MNSKLTVSHNSFFQNIWKIIQISSTKSYQAQSCLWVVQQRKKKGVLSHWRSMAAQFISSHFFVIVSTGVPIFTSTCLRIIISLCIHSSKKVTFPCMRNGFVSVISERNPRWYRSEIGISFAYIICTFQVVIGGLALIAILAITLGITLTADRNRSTSTPAAPLKAAGEPITFNDYINSNFRAKYFNGSWFSDNQLQWRDLENNLGK